MTTFLSDRLAHWLFVVGLAGAALAFASSLEVEGRALSQQALYSRPAPERPEQVKIKGHLLYLDRFDAQRERFTFPLLVLSVFLVGIGRAGRSSA